MGNGDMEWVDEDDVVVPNYVIKNFDSMRKYLEWISKHHPEIVKEYNKLKEVEK